MRVKDRSIATLLGLICVLLCTATASAQTGAVTAENGFQPNRDYLALQPFEAIDTASGNLVPTFTDLSLPGNGGRALTFNRVFNNRPMFQEPQWRFGISGVPLQVVQPDVPSNAQILNTIVSERSWAEAEDNGNLVLQNAAGTPIWWSGTEGYWGAYLHVQNDGNLVIVTPSGVPVWDSQTCCH